MEKIKGLYVAVLAAVSSALGILFVPVSLLVISNIIDYITGLFASKYRGENIDSNVGFKGILKKICMWILVLVGSMVDSLLLYAQEYMGLSIKINFLLASLVAVWLLANEIISILENINDMGIPMPSFLMPLVKRLKSQVEEKAEGSDIYE